jgi:predicted metal-dependent peptidase
MAQMIKALDPRDVAFNFDGELVKLMQDAPFFAEISRHIQKVPTLSIPTAAVSYNEKTDELCLLWNPEFFSSLSEWECRGVIIHELYHVVFGHLHGRRPSARTGIDLLWLYKMWNVATDCAINCIIVDAANTGVAKKLAGDRPLPRGCLLPGTFPVAPDGREYTEEEKQGMKLSSLIASLPTMQASEWYFAEILKAAEKESQKNGGKGKGQPGDEFGGETDTIDDHSMWDDVPDEKREYVEGRIKSVVEKAVKAADAVEGGWGNIPADLADQIRKSVQSVVNWKDVLRQFVGQLVRGGRTNSIKRINKKYPYIHPGTKRSYQAKLLVAIDQSGSVSNEMLVEFFAELGALTKKVTIDVLPFDCVANEKDIYTWRKGTDVPAKRVRGGGTDFNAPTKLVNDTRNRGRWDGMLIMTDGEAPAPTSSRVKRGWVLGKGCKMEFPTTELVVAMSDAKKVVGAWR